MLSAPVSTVVGGLPCVGKATIARELACRRRTAHLLEPWPEARVVDTASLAPGQAARLIEAWLAAASRA